MIKVRLLTFCLTLVFAGLACAQAAGNSIRSMESMEAIEPASSRLSAQWRLRLSGTDSHDELSQAKLIDIRTDFKLVYLLNPALQLDIQPSLRLQSGQTQSVNGADRAENKALLEQAAAHYEPFKALKLSAGALNQRYLHSSLLVDHLAFPAARIEKTFASNQMESKLAVETAIPTSTSLSTNTRELEPTPSLNTASFKFQHQVADNFSWKFSAGYFLFNNLPSAVAQQSGLLGNEVIKISEAQYRFVSAFEGLEFTTELQTRVFDVFDFKVGVDIIQNQKAASDQNKGIRYFANANFGIGKDTDFTIESSFFSIAPDAAVSYFNAGGFETNRIGYSLEGLFSFAKENFRTGLKYSDAEVLFQRDSQSREKTIILKLETFYANI